MTLRDVDGTFIRRKDGGFIRVQSIDEAEGIELLCPVCFMRNGGPCGTHCVICWAPGVPLNVKPAPGRWQLVGTNLDDLTLVAGSSSVFLQGAACRAHFYVRNGQIEIVP